MANSLKRPPTHRLQDKLPILDWKWSSVIRDIDLHHQQQTRECQIIASASCSLIKYVERKSLWSTDSLRKTKTDDGLDMLTEAFSKQALTPQLEVILKECEVCMVHCRKCKLNTFQSTLSHLQKNLTSFLRTSIIYLNLLCFNGFLSFN